MKPLILMVAGALIIGLSAPASASNATAGIQNSAQLTDAALTGKAVYADEVSSAKKKKKKKGAGSSWGG